MSLIDISNLTFAYSGSYDNIFENVSFQIDTDWRLGITGRNGRGKTTLLNLLLGKYEYSGSISSNVRFSYFPFEAGNKKEPAIDVITRINDDFEMWQLKRELSLLALEEDALYRPFETLSNGEQTKLLLAALFLQENGYLLIDEPTNHLDMTARQTVSRYLKSKNSFILVSHDRCFLDGCIDHILSINKTNIEIQKGNYSSWWENKTRQDNFEAAENDKLKKDIGSLKNSAARTKNWSDKLEKTKYNTKNSGIKADRGYVGHKSAKLMKRSKTVEQRAQNAIAEKSLLLKNTEEADSLKIHPLVYPSSRLISLDNVSIYYGEKQICDGISFSVDRGERIALCGRNGSGKSSILKLICGESIKYTGRLQTGSNLHVSFVSQSTSHLSGNLTEYAVCNCIDESLFKAILRKLDFSREQFDKDIRDFSAGQKKKVLLAKSLCDKAHLYIWDEPLNYIDILSRIQIEDLILAYNPTMLFVEHDSAFVSKVAVRTVTL